jgi:hypothetical protein
MSLWCDMREIVEHELQGTRSAIVTKEYETPGYIHSVY